MVSTCDVGTAPRPREFASRSVASCWCGRSYHRLGGKGLDLLDGLGSPLLEGDTMELFNPSAFNPIIKLRWSSYSFSGEATYSLVHVDGVLAGDDIRNGGALSLAGGLLGRRHG